MLYLENKIKMSGVVIFWCWHEVENDKFIARLENHLIVLFLFPYFLLVRNMLIII